MSRLLRCLLLLLFAFTSGLAAAQKGDESALVLFKKYFGQLKSTPDRVEAVLTLADVDDPGVFEVLYARLADKGIEPDVVRAIVRVFTGFPSEARRRQVFDALRTEKAEAGRVVLLQVVAQGKWKDKSGVLPPLLSDKSWEIRRHALQALLACDDASAAERIAPLCDDASDAVRLEALDALTSLASPLVVPKAIASLDHPARQVRRSAFRALTVVRHKSAVAPLIQRLNKEEGLLILDLAEALASLTGKEFGPAPEEWNKWWAEQKQDSYDIPPAEGIAFLRGRRATQTGASAWEIPKSKVTGEFFGTKTPSRQMIFVIDCSGSMEALVTEKERYEADKYPDLSRMEIVKTELMHEIDRLPPKVNFNIVAFATDVNPWKDKLQPATVTMKCAARDWIKTLYAIGGSSKEDLALVGLGNSASLEKGKTNAFGALQFALGANDARTAGANFEKVEADTIFFLSDGRPSVGEYVEPEDILREVRALNELRRVVIHAIAIGEAQKDFMQHLAEQNGPGTFVDLGK